MEVKIHYNSRAGLSIKIIYFTSIVTVLLVYVSASVKETSNISEIEDRIRPELQHKTHYQTQTLKEEQLNSGRQSRNVKMSSGFPLSSSKSTLQDVNPFIVKNVQTQEGGVNNKNVVDSEEEISYENSLLESRNFWDTLYTSARDVYINCSRVNRESDIHSNYKILGKCVKRYFIRKLKPKLTDNGTKLSILNGLFELETEQGEGFLLEDNRIGRDDKEEDEEEEGPHDYLADIDNLTKRMTLRFKLVPGIFFKMARKDDDVKFGFELDKNEFGNLHGRGQKGKKKLKKFLPLLLIPIALQFLLLPIVLGSLKLMASKALLAGKIALLLVIFNAIWMAVVPQHAEHNTKVAHDHYGYDGGMEYGAFINRRMERDRSLDLAYRGQR